jgi:hypothetical protein
VYLVASDVGTCSVYGALVIGFFVGEIGYFESCSWSISGLWNISRVKNFEALTLHKLVVRNSIHMRSQSNIAFLLLTLLVISRLALGLRFGRPYLGFGLF